jgi:hypothetical protein
MFNELPTIKSPTIFAIIIMRRGTSSLFGTLNLLNVKFSSKKPLIERILLSLIE